MMEYKQPWMGSDHWRKSQQLDGLCNQIKEDLRNETHQQVKNGPEELEWLVNPMRKQLLHSIELLFGTTGKNVKIVERVDHTFKTIEEM